MPIQKFFIFALSHLKLHFVNGEYNYKMYILQFKAYLHFILDNKLFCHKLFHGILVLIAQDKTMVA